MASRDSRLSRKRLRAPWLERLYTITKWLRNHHILTNRQQKYIINLFQYRSHFIASALTDTHQQHRRRLLVAYGRCARCGEPEWKRLTVDHIIAKADGGSNSIMNKQLLCVSCHKKKTKNEVMARKPAPLNL